MAAGKKGERVGGPEKGGGQIVQSEFDFVAYKYKIYI